MHDNNDESVDINLIARVHGEYLEMPGLQLTLAQASRLWDMKLATSAQVLERLVDASFLRRAGDRYVRADSGRICA
jgi:Fic family protein